MEALDRRYWRDRAMAVLPSSGPREIVRAAHVLATWYDGPVAVYDAIGSTLPTWWFGPGHDPFGADDLRDVKPVITRAPYVAPQIDARAFDGREGGGVPEMPLAPSPYDSRKHETRADGTVGRRGVARVQGSCVALDDSPNGHTPGLMCQMLSDLKVSVHLDSETDAMTIDPVVIGASAFDLLRLTHTFYAGSIPELLSTDSMAHAQIVNAAQGSDPDAVRGTVGRESANAKTATWPVRYRLRGVKARRSEMAGAAPSALIAPADDPAHVYVGFRLIPRGKVAARKPRTITTDRTIGTVTATRDDLARRAVAAAEHLNRGERVVITCDGVKLTLTRGKGAAGTFAIGAPSGKASGIRTPGAVATQALKLTA